MKKHLSDRRQKNHALAELDRLCRCAHCKTPLDMIRVRMGERFCSQECDEDHGEFQERWAAARARAESR